MAAFQKYNVMSPNKSTHNDGKKQANNIQRHSFSCQPIGDSPECDPARELSNRAFSLAPSNSSTESFIAVWKTAN